MRRIFTNCVLRRFKFTYVKKTTSGVKRKYELDPSLADNLPIFDYKPKTAPLNRVYAWGRAETGALGVKLNPERETNWVHHPKRLAFAHFNEVTDIACGFGFTAFAVKSNTAEKLFGCGINTDSQIGRHVYKGKVLDYILLPFSLALPVTDSNTEVKQVTAGRAHLLVLTTEGLFTLGNNAYGQCGRPVIEDEKYSGSSVIHKVPEFSTDAVEFVECGQDHSLAVTTTGEVYSCGWGADGQTGLNSFQNTSRFTLVKGDISKEKIIKVSSRADCVLALNDKGDVFGWGNSEYGQLLLKNNQQQVNNPIVLKDVSKHCGKVIDIASGGSFCLVLNEHRDVFIWGYGLLGLGPQVQQSSIPLKIPETLFGKSHFSPDCYPTSLACGLSHMAVLNSNGDLYTWGRNTSGNLGVGHKVDQFFPLKVSIGASVKKVSCGVDHTVAICEPFT